MNSPEKAEDIFLSALEIENIDKRNSFLDQQYKENPELKETVDNLIKDYEQASDLFKETTQKLNTLKNEINGDGLIPEASIGPYHIIGILGEGGCGIVYEAERREPLKLKVALKVLKTGMDTKAIMPRFETERQTLALMEHPNIAHVIDAGETQTGRPFFVMELVQGEKITDYSKKHALPINERLNLMLQVCAAIQHAHNKGVIHRDLKPSNILVSVLDDMIIPKVIDFGIAKATENYNGDTIQGQWIGTPAYMSPEQFSHNNQDVDTRSDVYSLGMILYELITDEPPFNNKKLLKQGFNKVSDYVQNQEPISPEKQCLRKKKYISKDLNLLILKAIHKEREKRYETVSELATDIANLLNKKPLKAHPSNNWYFLRKLILRNQLASVTIIISLLAVISGFSASTVLYLRAHEAELEESQLRIEAEEREHITKAAILIMQGKLVDADKEIRQINGVLTQTSLEATNVFRTLATWSAMNGDLKTSADRWLAMSRVNHFDDSDMSYNATEDLLPIGSILVTIQDLKRYSEFQEFLLQRLGKTTNPIAAEHVLKMCLLTPTSPKLQKRLIPTLEIAKQYTGKLDEDPVDRLESWRCIVVALWYYRNNEAETAIRYCNKALRIDHPEETRPTMAKLVRAMAYIATGDIQNANKDLVEASTSIDERFKKPLDPRTGGYWHDWLNVKILLNEAETLQSKNSNKS